jgi:hypothetical protein
MSEIAPTGSGSCAICMSAIGPGDATTVCEGCRSPYHAECWSDNGGCAVYGCAFVPKTDGLKPLEVPPAYWGREDKDCPSCGAKIMALAVRCRHCGSEVMARPEEKAAFARRTERRARTPVFRRNARLFLGLALLPVLSLLTLTAGAFYYRRNRDDIRRLSGGTDGLYRIAIFTAAAQCAILLLGVTAWWIKVIID